MKQEEKFLILLMWLEWNRLLDAYIKEANDTCWHKDRIPPNLGSSFFWKESKQGDKFWRVLDNEFRKDTGI